MKDPLRGLGVWPVPENKDISVTLFKDPRTQELEDKDWTFVLEDVSCLLLYNVYTYLKMKFFANKLPVCI